jgi:hypothetical protein
MQRDRRLVGGVVGAGLVSWFAYLALQPHDFWAGETLDRATLFGWDAPDFPMSSSDAPDRIWVALVGWALISLVAGWLRPHRGWTIGMCTVLPTWLVYWPTAPRSDDGLWAVGTFLLPFLTVGLTALAMLAGRERDVMGNHRHA